jgi:hypothetical protein
VTAHEPHERRGEPRHSRALPCRPSSTKSFSRNDCYLIGAGERGPRDGPPLQKPHGIPWLKSRERHGEGDGDRNLLLGDGATIAPPDVPEGHGRHRSAPRGSSPAAGREYRANGTRMSRANGKRGSPGCWGVTRLHRGRPLRPAQGGAQGQVAENLLDHRRLFNERDDWGQVFIICFWPDSSLRNFSGSAARFHESKEMKEGTPPNMN